MGEKDKSRWQTRLFLLLKEVRKFLRRWVSWSASLALVVAVLWYWSLINVALKQKEGKEKERIEAQKNALTSGEENTGGDPILETGDTLTTTQSNRVSRPASFNYSDEGGYANWRETIPLKRLVGFFGKPMLLIVCGSLLAILIGFYLIHKRRVYLERKVNESDSKKFVKLLEEFEADIARLGTPRRVKRQINKLRFQYNLLENEQVDFDVNEQKFLFDISLQAELDHSIFDSFSNLEKAQKESKYKNIDARYLRIVYDLNENVYGGDGVD